MFLIIANICVVLPQDRCETSCRFTQRIDIRLIYFCLQGEKVKEELKE